MAKGDYITVETRTGEVSIVAQQNGRKVIYEFEKELGIGWITVKEVTRGGTVVREAKVVASEVVVVVTNCKEE